jgi:tetratricopeptide (TPR) repeat protein
MSRRILAKILLFLVIMVCGLFCLQSSWAQGTIDRKIASQFFAQANSDYKAAKFNTAIENYEKIIGLGLENGNLYYNLGNSYFKAGKPGKAIFYYEKAKLFIPNDSDLKSNYDYVLSGLNVGPQYFGNWFAKVTYRLFEGLTVNALTILLWAIYIILIIIFTLKLFSSRLQKIARPLIFILLASFILSAIALDQKIVYLNKAAIIIGKEADVKFEPFESATTYFKLVEGSKVEVIEKAENWYKIKRPDGKIGWVDKASVGLVAVNLPIDKI